MKLEDETIFLVCWACKIIRYVIFWVYHMGLNKDSNNFVLTLQLFKEDSPKKIDISGPATPFEIP